jgi:hypothetical protein
VFDRLRKMVTGDEPPTTPVVIRVDDSRFGAFTVSGTWDPRVITVTGPWRATMTLSSTTVLSQGMSKRLSWVVPPPRIAPTGRDTVRLHVDGQPAVLDCGSRRMRRATFDVRAEVAGRRYLQHHEGRWRARLDRDGSTVTRLSTSDENKSVNAAHEPGADPIDATVGYAVGFVLGVGAPGFVRNLFSELF